MECLEELLDAVKVFLEACISERLEEQLTDAPVLRHTQEPVGVFKKISFGTLVQVTVKTIVEVLVPRIQEQKVDVVTMA